MLIDVTGWRCMSTGNATRIYWPPYLRPESIGDFRAVEDLTSSYSYSQLIRRSVILSSRLGRHFGSGALNAQQVAILCPNTAAFVVSQWATWQLGGVSVPLSLKHPPALLEYMLKNSETRVMLVAKEHEGFAQELRESLTAQQHEIHYYPVDMTTLSQPQRNDDLFDEWNHAPPAVALALFIYTSGTTGAPKGVVWTHGAVVNQIKSQVKCWNWQPPNRCVHALPLYHMHGLFNALLVPLAVGCFVHMLPYFNAAEVWKLLYAGAASKDPSTVFTGVPTMYTKLMDHWRDNIYVMEGAHTLKKAVKTRTRLTMCGSAPLTEATFNRWKNLSGVTLLERYGMSEIGMALSNQLDPESARQAGFVGQPMPGVTIRLCESSDDAKTSTLKILLEWRHGVDKPIIFGGVPNDGLISGSLLVKSDAMFKEYWRNEEATRKSFTNDGFFITGDVAAYDGSKNALKMLGRLSADIIKSSGYKLSALEIEHVLASCVLVEEIAVFGVPDDISGEKVVALVAVNKTELAKTKIKLSAEANTHDDSELLDALNSYAMTKLPKYSLLKDLIVVKEIPKNALGKVNKKELQVNYAAAHKST